MSDLNETPRANRIRIAFFGLRNAGKSTLVNAFTGQSLAIVSDTPGTTTDPVSKAMEILPLGPCLVTDTAGLDDVGELGAQRVAKTLAVLETTDVAVWVHGRGRTPAAPQDATDGRGRTPAAPQDAADPECPPYRLVADACRERKIALLEYHRGDSVEALKEKIAALKLVDDTPGLLEGLIRPGDRVICVCPIDESAPKGRLILPQVQVIRDCLDRHVACTVCQPEELFDCLSVGLFDFKGRLLVVTDSQAFSAVSSTIKQYKNSNNQTIHLTSFSILFARQKGDLDAYVRGLGAIKSLKDGDTVLVAEGCTHHRQCNDIGSVKIPKALAKLTGRRLNFLFASGGGFLDLGAGQQAHDNKAGAVDHPTRPSLIVQCGGCMLTRREVLRRIDLARKAGIPIVNYGLVLGLAAGIPVDKVLPDRLTLERQ